MLANLVLRTKDHTNRKKQETEQASIEHIVPRMTKNGNPLQYSCLGNPIDRGVRRATVQGVTRESDTT